jgi:hypothetical protein
MVKIRFKFSIQIQWRKTLKSPRSKVFTGVLALKILLKIRLRGKRGYDISSVPFKRLERAGKYRKKRWELKDGWLILEAF